jgi:uncharacterized membrane protein
METIERSIDIDRPVATVYNQWTQFEEYPAFMEGVVEVRQLGDERLHWVAEVAGRRVEWDAEIIRQEPDQVIAWSGFGDAENTGAVTFEALDADRTRVHLRLEYEPEGAVEEIGAKLGIVERRVEGDLARLRDFLESRRNETGEWRGRIDRDAAVGGADVAGMGTTGADPDAGRQPDEPGPVTGLPPSTSV